MVVGLSLSVISQSYVRVSRLTVLVCVQEVMAATPGLVAHVVNLAALVLLPMVVIHVHSEGFSLGEYASEIKVPCCVGHVGPCPGRQKGGTFLCVSVGK